MTEFTEPIQIPMKILTPVWTGDGSGRANGLKMSGVIGGMRHHFEMLVRKHGGRTCDITGEASQRCNYEQNTNICPACAVFGCTGLQRGFSLKMTLNPVSFVAPLYDNLISNRKHDGTPYNAPVVITKWLAVSSGCPGQMKDITDDQALGFMNTIKPAWPRHRNGALDLSIIPLNNYLKGMNIDLSHILSYLFGFMAEYSGLGAKVNHGWGIFCLKDNDDPFHAKGKKELEKLIDICSFTRGPENDLLPNAADCFSATWPLTKTSSGLKWPNKTIPRGKPYLCTGFAMAYRLRRYMKFYENDHAPEKLFTLSGGQSWDQNWRDLGNSLQEPWGRTKWRETIPFIRALFGRDDLDDDTKTAGLLGVSHSYQENGAWHVRLMGRIPPRYCYRSWDERNKRDTGTWLDWEAGVVREGIIDHFKTLLSEQDMWEKEKTFIKKTRGDL